MKASAPNRQGRPMSVLPDSPASLWLDQYGPYTPLPRLEGEVDLDVAVIGGGLVGMATAIHLRRMDPALSVGLLEARTGGDGAAGGNGAAALTVVGVGCGGTAVARGTG